jgi:hypothetical protein
MPCHDNVLHIPSSHCSIKCLPHAVVPQLVGDSEEAIMEASWPIVAVWASVVLEVCTQTADSRVAANHGHGI